MLSFSVLTKPLSENTAYPTNKQGRRFLTKEAKAYKEQIAWAAKMAKQNWEEKMAKQVAPHNYIYRLDGNFRVYLEFFWEDERRRDITNFIKLVLDAMTGIMWTDDCQIKEFGCCKKEGEPRIQIFIDKIE